MKSQRTLSPLEAGRIYGKFTPSPMGYIEEERDGKVIRIPMNRIARRAILFPNKTERKLRIREAREQKEKE